LTNLKYLNVKNNQISDLSSISELTNLLGFDCRNNPIDAEVASQLMRKAYDRYLEISGYTPKIRNPPPIQTNRLVY